MKPLRRALMVLFLAMALFSIAGSQMMTPPPVPTDLKAMFQWNGFYSFNLLGWRAPDGPWFFRIYRSMDDMQHFTAMRVTNMRRFEDYLIQPGHRYYYYVTSIAWMMDSVLAESAPSNIDSVTVAPDPGRPRGIIAGSVRDSLTGKPVPFARVQFYRRPFLWPFVPETWTDTLGQYSALLDTGSYLVHVQPWLAARNLPQFLPQWYDDVLVPWLATPVPVRENASSVADFSLHRVPVPPTALLSGTVRDSLGNPLRLAHVVVMRTVQDMQASAIGGDFSAANNMAQQIEGLGYCRGLVWTGLTDTLGNYRARLVAGTSYIVAAVKKFYAPQFYDHKRRPDEADIIRLTGDVTGIDFSLSLIPPINNSVAGMVMDSTGAGVPARVLLIPKRPQLTPLVVHFTATDSTGAFQFLGVRRGVYYAFALPYDNFAPAFYKKGAFGVMRWKDADTILVNGMVTGIDIGVVPVRATGIAIVRGTVTTTQPPLGELSGFAKMNVAAGLAGTNVYLKDAQGNVVGYALTDNGGAFAMTNVPAGTFTLTMDKAGYSGYTAPANVSAMSFDTPLPEVTMDPEVIVDVDEAAGVPQRFSLEQNYPNPFNPATRIRYSLPWAGQARLTVYNVLGEEVRTLVSAYQPAGTYTALFDAQGLASGVYFYRLSLESGQRSSHLDVKRMVLVK